MHSFVLKKHGGVLGLCRMLYQFAHYMEQQVTFTALAVFEFSEQRWNTVPLCGLSLHSLFFFLSYKLLTHAHTCVLVCPGGVVSGRAPTSALSSANIHTSVWHVLRNVVTPVRDLTVEWHARFCARSLCCSLNTIFWFGGFFLDTLF